MAGGDGDEEGEGLMLSDLPDDVDVAAIP